MPKINNNIVYCAIIISLLWILLVAGIIAKEQKELEKFELEYKAIDMSKHTDYEIPNDLFEENLFKLMTKRAK